LGLPEEQERAVGADGWFSTGDVGYLDEDGWLFLVDRIKDVFKHENWLVAPAEIEAALMRHPAVRDCAVVDCPDEITGAVPHAFAALEQPEPGRLEEAVRSVNQALPDCKRIRHAEAAEAIPRNPNGKLRRAELRAEVRNRLPHGDIDTATGTQ